PKVIVLRDGKRQDIRLKELVPGDIVFLDTGASVPADGVVLTAESLVINEAILTGESRPVSKQKHNLAGVTELSDIKGGEVHDSQSKKWVYMGTSISSGIGT